jgi:hypothetical protein
MLEKIFDRWTRTYKKCQEENIKAACPLLCFPVDINVRFRCGKKRD